METTEEALLEHNGPGLVVHREKKFSIDRKGRRSHQAETAQEPEGADGYGASTQGGSG